jgi:uncharacterized protein YkwD
MHGFGPVRARRWTLLALASMVLASGIAPEGNAAVQAARGCNGHARSSTHDKRFVRAVLCLQDAQRRKRGLTALRPRRDLSIAAARHARDMVRRRYFGHVSPTGTQPANRAIAVGYSGGHKTSVGENMLSHSTSITARAAIRFWLGSPSHRRDLLRRRWREVGVGVVRGTPLGARGGFTVVVEFGRRY